MKPSYLFLIVLFASASCDKRNEPADIVSVFVLTDQTGVEQKLPSLESIKKLCNLRMRDTWGARFSLMPIKDVEYTPINSIELPQEGMLLQNPGQRKKAINDFYAKAGVAINQMSLQPVGRTESEIFGPLMHALNALESQNVKEAYLIVGSDLQANTKEFSVYRDKDIEMLLKHPKKVENIILEDAHLGRLDNITCIFIYDAPDPESSRRFSLMASLFKGMLERKGAKVIITGGTFGNE
ncbi:MAG: hypothetical protein JSS76_16305 [Bacteroidetes bacterium]|nr:hypothetical protein [Bacteroidota bacterium]